MASAPLVSCGSCARTWHSQTMAEGLREIGSCPRCGGVLTFAKSVEERVASLPAAIPARAPHLVLGVPRR